MTITAPEAVGESLDPRDPLLRLQHVLRRRLQHRTAARAGPVGRARRGGHRQRCAHHRVLHRRHRHGRRDGRGGLCPHRQRLRHRHRGAEPDRRHLALRRRPARRGRKGAARGRPGVRGDDPGVGLRPADLGGRRLRRGRRRLRARADRRHRDGAGQPGVRHRPRHRAQCHRRGRRHGVARRPGHPPQEVRRVPHRRRRRARRLRARPPAGRIVLPAGPFRPQQGRGRRHRPARAAARLAAARLRRAPAGRRAARRRCAVRGVPGQVGAVDGGRPRPAVRAAPSACWPTTRCASVAA